MTDEYENIPSDAQPRPPVPARIWWELYKVLFGYPPFEGQLSWVDRINSVWRHRPRATVRRFQQWLTENDPASV